MSNETYKFQKLTPINDVDLGIYKNAINFIFDNPDLKNIAISGQYSAGKSSLIESYKKSCPEKRFVHISLSHFRTDSNVKVDELDKSINETVLEGKILNQLIHQINSEDIPQTHFKVKKKIKTRSVVTLTFSIVLFVTTILHVLQFSKWNRFVSLLSDGWLKQLLNFSAKPESLLISGVTCALFFFIITYSLIKAQKNRMALKKINLQGNEIEVFSDSDDSYFDRYLNEVLYLFDNIDADAIVFEDIDRFDANQIFERLHEINRLINLKNDLVDYGWRSSECIKNSWFSFLFKKQKNKLRFIYLVRDDIFVTKDRTKFFDYIIPVIPVVDSSNSYDYFISLFKDSNAELPFDNKFLQGVSLYVDDMRILKNIYNEFLIYNDRLNVTELDYNKMLAIITYKNIFPRDFCELQLNKGMLFSIFNNKDKIIKELIAGVKSEIKNMECEIEDINDEVLKSSYEVDLVYKDELIKLRNRYNVKEEIDEIEEKKKVRKENIKSRSDGKINIIKKTLSELRTELSSIENRKLKEIITRENADRIFKVNYINEIGDEREFNEIKSSEYFDLLKYLIRDGYIDETYSDYMTYFYENSLSRVDKVFLRSITDQKGKEFTYKLINPKLVVTRLRDMDFEQEEALNFDLLTYLLKEPVPENLITRLFKQLKENKCVTFIREYFDTESSQPSFIKQLNTLWPEFFSYALTDNEFSADWLKRYSIATIYYSDDSSIENINIDDCLTNYLSTSEGYLTIAEPEVDKLISGFKLLDVSFANIEFENIDKELFNMVYEHSLYDINFANLTLMLSKVYRLKNEAEMCGKNYTLVMSQPDSPLASYVNSNISNYLEIVLSNCDGSIMDDEAIVLSVLNNEDISDAQKEIYIKSLQTMVTSLSDIENESLWSSLLNKDSVVCSEENIVSYFVNIDELDDSIIGFINRTNAELNFENIENEEKTKLFKAIVTCNDLVDDKYSSLILSFNLCYSKAFGIKNIDSKKIRILIGKNIIHMTNESLCFIRDNYVDELEFYIEKNIETYIEMISQGDFILDEAISALSYNITDDFKIEILKLIESPIAISGKGYSSLINNNILKNHFEKSELLDLSSTYKSWDDSTKKIILERIIENISTLIENAIDLSDDLLKDLFAASELENVNKISLLTALLSSNNLSKELCKNYLDLSGLAEFSKILWRGKPKIEVDVTNQRLLEALRDNQLLSDFEEDKDNEGYYKITK